MSAKACCPFTELFSISKLLPRDNDLNLFEFFIVPKNKVQLERGVLHQLRSNSLKNLDSTAYLVTVSNDLSEILQLTSPSL
jgi:hypothetical protein